MCQVHLAAMFESFASRLGRELATGPAGGEIVLDVACGNFSEREVIPKPT